MHLVCACVFLCVFVCMFVCVYIFVYVCICLCVYCIVLYCMSVCVCVFVCMLVCILHMYVSVRVCVSVHMYVQVAGVGSLLLPCGSQGSSARQEPLSAEPPWQFQGHKGEGAAFLASQALLWFPIALGIE